MVESKCIIGGSGFMTLLYHSKDQPADAKPSDNRLSYLQTHRDTPPTPDGLWPGAVQVSFFEQWNADLWKSLLALTDGHVLSMLRIGAEHGTIGLCKIIKSPSGVMRGRVYHLGEGSSINLPGGPDDREEFELIKGTGIMAPKTLDITYSETTLV